MTGLFIAQGFIKTRSGLPVWILAVAAIVGNATGYWIGYKVGPEAVQQAGLKFFP